VNGTDRQQPYTFLRKGSPEKKRPVIVELPGNGGYKDSLGDECSGCPEDCHMGYGMTGGQDFLTSVLHNETD